MTDADLKKRTHVTRDDIKAGLSRLGLEKGDNAGVHSSLSSFGYVEGGADRIAPAVDQVLGGQLRRLQQRLAR